jgi:hypothetical protein
LTDAATTASCVVAAAAFKDDLLSLRLKLLMLSFGVRVITL